MSLIEREFHEYDEKRTWPIVYQQLKNEASIASIEQEFSVREARKPENRGKNRYRDVSPYDHSRVILQQGPSDYINASCINVPESNRRYILSQGPLEHTSGHFWQMIWEQNTKAVIMLNKLIEKGTLKCHPYWPSGDEDDDEIVFEETNLKVTLLEEEDYTHYIIRTLDLENIETKESREVLHFHYITWPDFGVPSSPDAFLTFLEAVRGQGVLENDVGPPVIHCSAGIGRSGTFCLVDTALVLVEKQQSLQEINVKSLLLSMRSYRMGLIQTPEQLRFSYLAIIHGGRKMVLSDGAEQVNDVLEEYMDMSAGSKDKDVPPPPPHRTSSLSPTKRQHPPSPPLRSDPEEDDRENDEPHVKTHKTDNAHDKMSPVKPPRVGLTEMNKNSGDNETNMVKKVAENNNPVGGDHLDMSQSEQGTQESNSTSHEDSARGSETELRRRRREERKQKTQELIEKMKEKQRHSETWKKRKSYMKPIAIGLTLLIGGLLLYKVYF